MDEVLIPVMSTQPFLHKPALQNYKMIHKKESGKQLFRVGLFARQQNSFGCIFCHLFPYHSPYSTQCILGLLSLQGIWDAALKFGQKFLLEQPSNR